MFTSLYKTLLDIIFPQNEIEKEISSLSSDGLAEKLHTQEQNGVISLFRYKDQLIRQMIWLLKYKGDKHVAKLFATILHDHLIEELADEIIFSSGVKCVIVPLPLSKKRKRERGFNQMELITNELQKLGDISIDTHILVRIKHTKPQTSLSNKAERVRNVKGVFDVQNQSNIKNTHLILIDDVFTTGSTLKEASRTLKEAGAYKVSRITLAH